jgi:peptide/nickel transport system substrate-binding protein
MRFARPAMKVAVLSVVGATAIAACGGSSGGGSATKSGGGAAGSVTIPGGLGSIPAQSGKPKTAGTFKWAMSPGAVPNWIFPQNTSSTNSVYNAFTFQYEMWRPLYWTVKGVVPTVVPSMSLAANPVWSNGNKTATITMNSNYKWSDGTPVTANDLLFSIDMIKAGLKESPSNWSGFVPGFFPDDLVSAQVKGTSTLVLNLKSAVNPTWFQEDIIGGIVPMPAQAWAKTSASGKTVDFTTPANAKKIFDFLTAQSKSVTTYASNPLWQTVDGPYKLTAFNSTNGGFTMKPNTSYDGPHAAVMSSFQGVPFTSDTAEFNAVKTKSVDLGFIPQTDVPQIAAVKKLGFNVFGEADFGMTFANYNFKDKTGHFNSIVSQLYFRQAMAHLEDQDGYVKAFFGGAGAPAYGPIPATPKSPFLPASAATDPYPFSVSAATALLKSHGWKINAGGTDTCASPGSGATQCGAGIPAGTKLAFNLIYSTNPSIIGEQMTDLTSKAKQAGIHITLTTSNFNFMISNYIDPAAPANENKWAMMDFGGETDSTYPTTFGLFNTGGSGQIGDYTDPQADKLIHASITGSNPAAVSSEASYLTKSQPVLFEPNPDFIWAWKSSMSGTPDSFSSLTQFYATPEFWYNK